MKIVWWNLPSPVSGWPVRGSESDLATAMISPMRETINIQKILEFPRARIPLSKMQCSLNTTLELCPYENTSSQNFHPLQSSGRRKSSLSARTVHLIEKEMMHFRNLWIRQLLVYEMTRRFLHKNEANNGHLSRNVSIPQTQHLQILLEQGYSPSQR